MSRPRPPPQTAANLCRLPAGNGVPTEELGEGEPIKFEEPAYELRWVCSVVGTSSCLHRPAGEAFCPHLVGGAHSVCPAAGLTILLLQLRVPGRL